MTTHYPISVAGKDWQISFRSLPTPLVERIGRMPMLQEVQDAFRSHLFSSLPIILPEIVWIAAHGVEAKPLDLSTAEALR
jgi:hypothetical protein